MPRPRVYQDPPVQTMVRLPRELHARLRAEADRRGLSINALVIRLVASGLANAERRRQRHR